MKSVILIFTLFFMSLLSFGQKVEGWSILADVRFEDVYFEEVDQYFLKPIFGKKLLKASKTEVTITGFVMPFEVEGEDKMIILSQNPYSSCFFCGGAGPETVAEIHFKKKPKRFSPDEVIQVKGILHLNDSDVDHLNYMIKEATIIEIP
ncbi:hypothetical protein BC781_1011378 [Sediminitomix flava]|uniref:DUF3299 domain-containing protein n=2 Tax=Sediminitomix flava TaxID=379075 RepID=A0A315ZI50_SEDFL|nr:hypothetical protein BC781_1011378 [Sediminitomix flava]